MEQKPSEFIRYLNTHPFANKLKQEQKSGTFVLKATFTIITFLTLIFIMLGTVS